MTCPYLEYRDESDGQRFDEARAYCTAADRFVQPMRADICNDRYDLEHDRHCEIYLEHADGSDGGSGAKTDGGSAAGADDGNAAEDHDANAAGGDR